MHQDVVPAKSAGHILAKVSRDTLRASVPIHNFAVTIDKVDPHTQRVQGGLEHTRIVQVQHRHAPLSLSSASLSTSFSVFWPISEPAQHLSHRMRRRKCYI